MFMECAFLRRVACETCGGTGRRGRATGKKLCPACGGTGRVSACDEVLRAGIRYRCPGCPGGEKQEC